MIKFPKRRKYIEESEVNANRCEKIKSKNYRISVFRSAHIGNRIAFEFYSGSADAIGTLMMFMLGSILLILWNGIFLSGGGYVHDAHGRRDR